MKRNCKNIDITDWKTVLPWVSECVRRHAKRYDFRKLLEVGGMEKEDYQRAVEGEKWLLADAEQRIAKEAVKRIVERDLALPPVTIKEKVDVSTGKLRLIGCESAMQQVFDYIAVKSCDDIWKRRIVPQQASSIKGRGQAYGVRMISRYLNKDKRAVDWAHRHGTSYYPKCKYHVKLDAAKCYQSLRMGTFMEKFHRDCGNGDILWLWETLLKSHRVALKDGGVYEGFMIGALPSQIAVQYLLSFIYRFAMGLHKERRGRGIRLVSHMIMFMDDMLLFAPDRRNLKMACRKIITYAKDEIGLAIKPGWQICITKDTPVDMMGYLIHTDGGISVRPRVFIRARRIALRALHRGLSFRQARRLISYKGYFTQKNLSICSGKIMEKLHLKELFKRASEIISRRERSCDADRIRCEARRDHVYAAA